MTTDNERWEQGLAMMDTVYQANHSERMKDGKDSPFVAQSVEYLFGTIWSMPSLSMKEKRLLVIGATTMLGRSDLIETQIGGALANGELSDEQLEEIAMLMSLYAGIGNSTALYRGIQTAKAKRDSSATQS